MTLLERRLPNAMLFLVVVHAKADQPPIRRLESNSAVRADSHERTRSVADHIRALSIYASAPRPDALNKPAVHQFALAAS